MASEREGDEIAGMMVPERARAAFVAVRDLARSHSPSEALVTVHNALLSLYREYPDKVHGKASGIACQMLQGVVSRVDDAVEEMLEDVKQ